jgi:hypothetical protein
LKQEKSRRIESNKAAVAVLSEYKQLWTDAQGPCVAELFDPTEAAVERAKQVSSSLKTGLKAGALAHPSLAAYTDDDRALAIARITDAAHAVQATSWEAIRRQRFTCTPDGLWEEITKVVDTVIECCRGDASRQAAHRALVDDTISDNEGDGGDVGEHDCDWLPAEVAASSPSPDPRLDPDEFKQAMCRKPYKWNDAVSLASEVHVSQMRLLLEMHYGDIHLAAFHQKRVGERTRFRISEKIVSVYVRELHEQMHLPTSVKNILREPADEGSWAVLEKLRAAIVDEVEGIYELVLADADLVKAVCEVVDTAKLQGNACIMVGKKQR